MAGATITTGAGFDSVQFSRRSSAGYATGRAGLTSANTTVYSEAYRLIGANASEITLGEPVVVTNKGDDQPIAQFQFNPTTLPSFGLTTVSQDFTFNNMVSSLSNKTLGGATINAGTPNGIDLNQVITLYTRQAQSLESATSGDAQYEHFLFLNSQVRKVGNPLSFQSEGSYTHTVTASNAKRTAWGETLPTAFTGLAQTPLLYMTSQYRMTFGAFVGDNADVAFDVLQTPVGASNAWAFKESASGSNSFSSATISDITSKTVTLSAAPASGAFVIIFYEFEEWE